MSSCPQPVVLTGDRTTGPLHLGHYAGSLKSRVALQRTHRQFLLLADAQALTDNATDPARVTRNILEVAADYLAVGLDPQANVICVQSALPALAELTTLYLNFVSVARLERNPTVKDEIRSRGFGRDIPAGFLCYPAAQAADITAFKATLVPVGDDQVPMIEQSNEIVRRLNRQIGRTVLPEARAMLTASARLPAPDGKGKMSKSQGSAIPLSASDAHIAAAVASMYTDADHLRVSDPGRVEGNVVFAYLDAFDGDRHAVADLKVRYRRGGLGDVALKQRLTIVLRDLVGPIRERRAEVMRRPDTVMDMLRHGTERAKAVTRETRAELQEALGIFAWPKGSHAARDFPVPEQSPRPRHPTAKVRSLEEVRAAIDRIDRDIVRLMADRGACVQDAVRFKGSPAEVEAPRRVEEVVSNVRSLAIAAGLPPRVAEAAYRPMIAAFIDLEQEAFATRLTARSATHSPRHPSRAPGDA